MKAAIALAVAMLSAGAALAQPTKEECPARFNLSLEKLFNGEKRAEYRTGKTATVHCHRAYIASMVMTRRPDFYQKGKVDITIKPMVQLLAGQDAVVTIDFTLKQGDEVLGHLQQTMQADEGEINWGDELQLQLPAAPAASPVPHLEIELTAEPR